MGDVPTLHEWQAIERMIGCFYDRVERDNLLSPLFPGGVSAAHREHVTTWWCEVFGGPAEYTERLGGYPAMLAHHRDLGITTDQRFRFASLMSLAADDADLPSDPEIQGRAGRLPGMGHPAGHAQLPARRRRRAAGPGTALGLGASPRPTSPDPPIGTPETESTTLTSQLGHAIADHPV